MLYVFDCLTDLLKHWHSDLMIGNFFKATCPYLYELDTIAYFAIMRNYHTYNTIAGIRETTQLLLDLYQIKDKTYIHPLKVWQRYSPTMFFPHLIQGQEAICITSSSDASELFNSITGIPSSTKQKECLAFPIKNRIQSKNALCTCLSVVTPECFSCATNTLHSRIYLI